MTIRFVGSGGNDASDGLSWVNRKLTLNGVENTPVEAGDTCYIGPGVYRETLTVDVSGISGSPITYIGDVTGEHTDGIGGIVRITGSDNDTTAARANCITATSKNYRTFQGFSFDTATSYLVSLITSCGNWIIEDCAIMGNYVANIANINIAGTGTNNTVRNCYFGETRSYHINFTHSAEVSDAGHLVENCIFIGGAYTNHVYFTRVGGGTVKNCTFVSGNNGIVISFGLAVGQSIVVNNCTFIGQTVTLVGTAIGEIVENYNTIYAAVTARTNVATGANSNTYPPLFNPPILQDGFRFPWYFGELSKWSQIARIAGTGEATDDMFGFTRPATSSKKSWGAIQYTGAAREATTIDGASGASLKLPDAAELFLMRVPVANVSTVFTVKAYREANYTGTNPTLIIRQPGQSDISFVDVGAAEAWNTLTVTGTPAASPGWVDMVVASYNTALSGSYSVFFDTVEVT